MKGGQQKSWMCEQCHAKINIHESKFFNSHVIQKHGVCPLCNKLRHLVWCRK